MSLVERIVIAVPPERVWPLIADPVLMAGWNRKIVSIERQGSGPVGRGERMEILYRMSGRERILKVEVVEIEPLREMTWRHNFGEDPKRYALERYALKARGAGTCVEQHLDLRHAGLPWWVRVLMAFLWRFGWKGGGIGA
jgi:uncharacterized protein YndB with AHSA1/START domain